MQGQARPAPEGNRGPYALTRWTGSATDDATELDVRRRAALEAFEIGTLGWAIETRRLDTDAGIERILGRALGEGPHSIDELLDATHEADRARLANTLERAANEQAELREEVRLRRPDGSVRWVELRGRVGAVPGRGRPLLVACADVTERRLQDEHKAELIAVLSHELRTPLNAIGGYAALMLEGIPSQLTSRQADYVRRIRISYQHVMELIDALLTQAKAAAGRIEYQIRNVSVGEVLDEIEPLTAPQRAAKRLTYDCSACDRGMVLRADPGKVEQILVNLIANAVKFTRPNGRITLATERIGLRQGAVLVCDTGVGLSPAELRRAFDAFTQFSRTSAGGDEGTGLGLSISRDLARGMAGDLTAESEPGRGSAFKLTLPLVPLESGPSPPRSRE